MAKANKTHFPDDFKVTEPLRKWALDKYGYENLPDCFIKPFKTNWRDRIEDGRPPKWKSPELALKRWIRESSPSGSMYSAKNWEEAVEKSKMAQYRKEIKTELPKIKTTPKPANRNKALNELKKARLILESSN